MEYEKIKKIIAEVLCFDESEINMDTRFTDDLGADSLDLYQIITEIEDQFSLPELEQEELEGIITVADAVDAVKRKLGE